MTASGGRPRSKSKKKRSSKTGDWPRSAGWIAVVAITLVVVLWWVLKPGQDPSAPAVDGLEAKLRSMAAERGVTPDDLARGILPALVGDPLPESD